MSSRAEPLIDVFLRLDGMAQLLWRVTAVVCLIALCCYTCAPFLVARRATDARIGRLLKLFSSEAGFCTFAAFTILLLRVPCLTLPQCNVDEGQWIAGAITLSHDPRFWGSVDGTTSGPLVIYSLLSAKLFGSTIDYVSARCLANVLWAATVVFTYLTFRLVSPSCVARLLVLPFVATVALLNSGEYVGYNGEHLPVCILAFAFWLAASMVLTGSQRNWQLLLLGFVLGSIPFAKLQAVPMGMTIGVVTLICTAKWRNKAVLAASALAPTVLVFCYLQAFQLVQDFWHSYILSNLNYASKVSHVTPWKRVIRLPFFLFASEDTRPYFLMQSLAVIVLLTLVILRWRSFDNTARRVLLLAVLYLFGGYYSVLQPGTFYGHYFLFLLHPLVLVSGMSIVFLAGTHATAGRGLVNPAWAGLFMAAMVIGPACRVLTLGNAALNNLESRKELMQPGPVAHTIQEIRTNQSSLAVWGWAPHFYVQTQMRQAARDAHTFHEITEGPLQPYYTDRFVKDLAAKPHVIFVDVANSVDSKYFKEERFRHENFPAVAELIRSKFRFVADYYGSRIYISN